MTHSTPSLWEEFLKRYYWEEILELALEYPHRTSMTINFADVQKFDFEFANTLESEPDTTLADANDALRGMDIPADVELAKAEVRIRGFPAMKLRDIRSEHVGKLIAVTGTIVKETDVKGKVIEAAFRCARCGDLTRLPQTDPGKFVEPFECQNDNCGRKGPFTLEEKVSIFVDTKKIRLQESYEDLGGGQHPQIMDMEFVGSLSSLCQAGDDVTVTGIVRLNQRNTQQGKSPLFDYNILVNSVELCENISDIIITPEDMKNITELAKDPDITNRLICSFANSIHGHESPKEASLLSCVSPDSVVLPDGSIQRGASHVLLVGDPGVAKTQILRAATRLIVRSQYVTGDGSSKVGLTAAVVKDDFDGRWSLEAGALVLADKALAAIDELDRVKKEDIAHLNTCLESGQIFINKAGINRMLRTRTPVIAALNPKFGRFDIYEPLPGQVNIPPSTLSRFDLIFFLEDKPNPEKDRNIAESQARLWQAASQVDAGGKEWSDFPDVIPDISPDLMRKYLIVAKQIKVEISDECTEKVLKFFLPLRNKYGAGDGTRVIPVAWRQHDALFRLVKAEARLRHSRVAELQDAGRTIDLVSESMRQAGTDPETGELDSDLISTGMGKSQRDRLRLIIEVVRSLQGATGNSVPIDLLTQTLEREGLKKEYISDAIAKLKSAGDLIEVSAGRFRVV
ncbi:MAG: minichromosome maintenance protein MCM [Candidatus Methanoperedens sp.]